MFSRPTFSLPSQAMEQPTPFSSSLSRSPRRSHPLRALPGRFLSPFAHPPRHSARCFPHRQFSLRDRLPWSLPTLRAYFEAPTSAHTCERLPAGCVVTLWALAAFECLLHSHPRWLTLLREAHRGLPSRSAPATKVPFGLACYPSRLPTVRPRSTNQGTPHWCAVRRPSLTFWLTLSRDSIPSLRASCWNSRPVPRECYT